MSYWAATVITNLISVLPIRRFMLSVLWGGSYCRQVTVVRFLTLHIMIPLILLGMIMLHICVLHTYYSEIPGGDDYNMKFSVLLNKDILGILIIA
jgi:ubiquinol-cytochrome c reductase cytochrome b subunit